jgi:hypothetical protein
MAAAVGAPILGNCRRRWQSGRASSNAMAWSSQSCGWARLFARSWTRAGIANTSSSMCVTLSAYKTSTETQIVCVPQDRRSTRFVARSPPACFPATRL